jgi:hypothetical protein
MSILELIRFTPYITDITFYISKVYYLPVPVAARSEGWVCGRFPAEIVGFESHRGMDVCLL